MQQSQARWRCTPLARDRPIEGAEAIDSWPLTSGPLKDRGNEICSSGTIDGHGGGMGR